jgi:hypothetical protein
VKVADYGFFGYNSTLKIPLNYRFSLKFFGLFTGVGLLATLLFDVWTAFGWWFLFYPHTLSSLLLVYILQIPFTFT